MDVDAQKLKQLESRIKNSKTPTKPLSSFLSDSVNVHNLSSAENDKMIIEEHSTKKKVVKSPSQISQADTDSHDGGEWEKENLPTSKLSLNLESSEKMEEIQPQERRVLKGITKSNQSHELSYESNELRGSQSIKRRKYDQVEQGSEKAGESFDPQTKKVKLTPLPTTTIDNSLIRIDSKGSSVGTEVVSGKDSTTGKKLLTEYYKLRDTPTNSKKTPLKMTGSKKKVSSIFEKKSEVILEAKASKEFDHEDRKELYGKIKELEDKIEVNKKERERDQRMASNEIKVCQEKFDKYKSKVQNMGAKFSIQLENYKRNERKAFLNQQRQRLGEYVSQREGNKFVDVWCDGFEVRTLKEKLETMMKQKEELEKQKKNLNSKKANTNAKTANEANPTNIEETKERIIAQITILQREENILKEQLEKLEVEKESFYQQFKRQYEEDHSRYGKPSAETNAPAWPILSERYQLLSLLGKGGFSEVYKAYDLEELTYVACKVHQLNPNWTEKSKTNYVKHANREFEVHKDLEHPNIVRLFDCINIDDHSFATVLEHCEGPDLSVYLKQHKILPEKDAKVIIKQILAGLKYLSDHKTKIIHYDLKPQNVLFHKGEIKISDFGLCKVVDSEQSRIELTSQGVGTYWYLPPECFQMDDQPPLINSKVDVWSVGVMYFEMIFGQRPFGHNMSQEKILKEQIILKSHTVNFPSKPAVSAEAKDFIKKCLAYHQESRIDIYQAYDLMFFPKK